jgi:hypothetical protein
MPVPGAEISGFIRPLPSAVTGPRLEDEEIMSASEVLPTVNEARTCLLHTNRAAGGAHIARGVHSQDACLADIIYDGNNTLGSVQPSLEGSTRN